MLEVSNLGVRFRQHEIFKNVNFKVDDGMWLMIVGPNGAGKSTIINAITQSVPYQGTVRFEEKNIKEYKAVENARNMAVLLQNHIVEYAFTVEEIVSLGRYAHDPTIFSGASQESEDMVEKAMAITGVNAFRTQNVMTLSGGETQRTFLAQAIAQNPKLLILDEPTNHLDLVYQKQIFDLVQEWLKIPGHAVISVVHDLSLAKLYGTHALLLKKRGSSVFGTVDEVMTNEILNEYFSMDIKKWMDFKYQPWKEEA